MENHQRVDTIIDVCLSYLVTSGFVSKKELHNSNFYSRYDMNDRLEELQFLAAASIDDSGRPVIIFNIHQPIKKIAWCMGHEVIHLAQLCKGDWEPFSGYSFWKGKKYANLKADDLNYFSVTHQPWEAEAKEHEDKVRNALYETLPALKV